MIFAEEFMVKVGTGTISTEASQTLLMLFVIFLKSNYLRTCFHSKNLEAFLLLTENLGIIDLCYMVCCLLYMPQDLHDPMCF